MSRPNRGDIVDPDNPGMYHCYSRCVQRAYLCGYDQETGENLDHRKQWIEDRQIVLASIFAMELQGYAILDNHMHHVIRTRPDIASEWSDEEVVRRWLRLHPPRDGRGNVLEVTDDRVNEIVANPVMVDVWRKRLASLSWYMKDLKEYIAKRANKESGKSGHFFEARFSSPKLADTLTLLLCLLYVELNPIRAGAFNTPEESMFTSVRRRAQSWQIRNRRDNRPVDPDCVDPDAFLSPINENGEPGNHTAPRHRVTDRGVLPLTAEQFLELVDFSGRQIRSDKRGKIPGHLAPILDRLCVDPDCWLDPSGHYQHRLKRSARRVDVGKTSDDNGKT